MSRLWKVDSEARFLRPNVSYNEQHSISCEEAIGRVVEKCGSWPSEIDVNVIRRMPAIQAEIRCSEAIRIQ
jgi:hypothetical protein